jgi:hypothetical protein
MVREVIAFTITAVIGLGFMVGAYWFGRRDGIKRGRMDGHTDYHWHTQPDVKCQRCQDAGWVR